jgi:hypothetical protein
MDETRHRPKRQLVPKIGGWAPVSAFGRNQTLFQTVAKGSPNATLHGVWSNRRFERHLKHLSFFNVIHFGIFN